MFRTRYSGAGLRTMSYVTLYIIRSILSMRRWSKGCQVKALQHSSNAGGVSIVSGHTLQSFFGLLHFYLYICRGVCTIQLKHTPTVV